LHEYVGEERGVFEVILCDSLLQATIKGMPFEEWGDPGTIYKVLYVWRRAAQNVIVHNEMRLARKARPPNFRLAGTFWVSICLGSL
jgi:hypothetical protein